MSLMIDLVRQGAKFRRVSAAGIPLSSAAVDGRRPDAPVSRKRIRAPRRSPRESASGSEAGAFLFEDLAFRERRLG
jgi:hypothetical protein